MSKYLLVIAGPTAVGKTKLSIQLAQHFQTEILSADAKQFYQGVSIGTAQPTLEERQGIPHHFLAFLPILENYTAGRFAKAAWEVLHHIFLHHDVAIVVGGTGLYLQALCEGLVAIPTPTPALRTMLNHTLAEKGLPYLVKWLSQQDPSYHNLVDRNNPQRVIRALEICLHTGIPYTIWRQQPRQKPTISFNTLKIGLSATKSLLHQRIEERVDAMMEQGLLAEVEKLYPYRTAPALQTIGYKELWPYLEGTILLEESVKQIKNNTKHYAKRQMTWFSRDKDIKWFAQQTLKDLYSYLDSVVIMGVQ